MAKTFSKQTTNYNASMMCSDIFGLLNINDKVQIRPAHQPWHLALDRIPFVQTGELFGNQFRQLVLGRGVLVRPPQENITGYAK